MRDADMRRVFGLTWAGWLNCLLLQWLCLRLQRDVEDNGVISCWALIWAPIWKYGWSLPTFRKRKRKPYPGPFGKAVYRTADGGKFHIVADTDVRPGDPVIVTARGLEVSPSNKTPQHIPIGRWLTSANQGDVAVVEIGPVEVKDVA